MADPRSPRRDRSQGSGSRDLAAVGERVGAALMRMADRYEPSFDLDHVVSRSDEQMTTVLVEHAAPPRLTRPRLARCAAALLVLAGVSAVAWHVNRIGEGDRTISPSRQTPTTVPDGNLIADIDTSAPEQLAVINPAPGGVAPRRENPYFDWLMGEPAPELRRTFASAVGDDGLPTAVLFVTDGPDVLGVLNGWESLPVAGVDGVDARITQSDAVSWPSDNGLTSVAGLGDVDLDVVVSYARIVVGAGGVSDAPTPAGFTELGEVEPLGWVSYSKVGATGMSLSLFRGDDPLSWQVLQFLPIIEPDRVEAMPNGDGWVYVRPDGVSYAWINVDDQFWVAIVSPTDPIDPATIASKVRIVPGDTIPATPIGNAWTFGVPDDVELVAAGELTTGRFLVLTYEELGRACTHVAFDYEPRGFPRSRSCATDGARLADCWSVHVPHSDLGDPYVVWVDDSFETVTVTVNGQSVAPTFDHVGGLTFAAGVASQPIDTIGATAGDDEIC